MGSCRTLSTNTSISVVSPTLRDIVKAVVELNGTDGSSTNAGDRIVLDGTDSSSTNQNDSLLYEEATDDVGLTTGTAVDNFTFDGNTKVEGTMRASSTGAIKIEGNDSAGGILLLNQSASGVDVGSALVFEEGSDDGSAALLNVTRLTKLNNFSGNEVAVSGIEIGHPNEVVFSIE